MEGQSIRVAEWRRGSLAARARWRDVAWVATVSLMGVLLLAQAVPALWSVWVAIGLAVSIWFGWIRLRWNIVETREILSSLDLPPFVLTEVHIRHMIQDRYETSGTDRGRLWLEGNRLRFVGERMNFDLGPGVALEATLLANNQVVELILAGKAEPIYLWFKMADDPDFLKRIVIEFANLKSRREHIDNFSLYPPLRPWISSKVHGTVNTICMEATALLVIVNIALYIKDSKFLFNIGILTPAFMLMLFWVESMRTQRLRSIEARSQAFDDAPKLARQEAG